jgi:hypothetical protein
MTKDYHLTQEQALKLLVGLPIEYSKSDDGTLITILGADSLQAYVNDALDKVLGEPVGKVVDVAAEGCSPMPWISFNAQAEDLSLGTKLYAPKGLT